MKKGIIFISIMILFSFSVYASVEIDPNDVWVPYGHEFIGQIEVTEDLTGAGGISTKTTSVNEVKTTEVTIQQSSSSGGGGGGSAAGTAAAEAIRAKSQIAAESIPKVWFSIAKGEEKTYENKKPEISVSEITFNVQEEAKQAEISVSSLKSNPVTSISKPVYQYLEINSKNVDTKEAKIRFNVEKQWINENNIDKSSVKLNRYTDRWNELITNEVGSDYNNIVYESISPGFSYFAVTAENKTAIQEVEEKVIVEEVLEKELAEVKEKGINVLVWIIAIFSVLLVWYYYVVKLNKKGKKKK